MRASAFSTVKAAVPRRWSATSARAATRSFWTSTKRMTDWEVTSVTTWYCLDLKYLGLHLRPGEMVVVRLGSLSFREATYRVGYFATDPRGAGCPESVVSPKRRRHRGSRPLEEVLHRYPLHAAGYAGGRCDAWITGRYWCSTSARQPVRRPSSDGWTAAGRRKKRTALWVEPESGSVS